MTALDPTTDRELDRVRCGTCDQPVPTGGAHIVVNYHAAGHHQMFCPEHCPCLEPGKVRPHRENLT